MATSDSKIADFAEELGKLLGSAESKAKDWLAQREHIAKSLTGIRDSANNLLQELTGGGAAMAVAVRRGRRGRPPGKRGPGRPPKNGRRKRTMSADARRRISEAQKARWAKQKAGEKKK